MAKTTPCSGRKSFDEGPREDGERILDGPDGANNFVYLFIGDSLQGTHDEAIAGGIAQVPGEPPLVGVAVDLYNAANAKIGTAITGTDGTYLFGGVTNANLTGGSQVAKATLCSVRLDRPADFAVVGAVAGFMLTTADQGVNDLADSDASSVTNPTGSWPVIETTTGRAGTNNHTLDFGFLPEYAVGNRVFADTDNSGAMDSGETGIDGVAVELYGADSSGAPTGAVIRVDTTAAGGFYRFDGLPAGRYVVVVKSANFATGQPLVGKGRSTGASQEAGPDIDEDLNDYGLDTPLTAGFVHPGGIASGVITLGPKVTLLGGEPTALASLAFAMIGLGLVLLRQRRRFLSDPAR